jgi:hypothetical protein
MGGELTESLSDGTKLMKVYLAIDVPRCAEKEAVEVAVQWRKTGRTRREERRRMEEIERGLTASVRVLQLLARSSLGFIY